MREPLPGLAGVLARCLPAEAAARWFAPAVYDLLSYHAERQPRFRVAAWVALHARVCAAFVSTVALTADARRPSPRLEPPAPRSRGVDPMLRQDLRFALRMLWKDSGFTAVAVAALALGIGANAAIFSVVNAVLLRPLPYPDPSRIVEINETGRRGLMTVSPPNFMDWKAQARSFETMAAYQERTVTLAGTFEPERMSAVSVGVDAFKVLGVPPLFGRVFEPQEERTGGPDVVVIGHAFWQSRFGGDPAAVGRTVVFEGKPCTVVGIMPRGFTFPDQIDLWFPLVLTERDLRPNQRGAHYLGAIGRLAPGVTLEQAIEELAAIERNIALKFPRPLEGTGIWARRLLDSMVGDVRRALLMLLGAVAFVLLIACVNVSNLLLARSTTRRGEIAVRSALGAGRWRIVRQLLAESIILSLLGGALGMVVASWGVRALVTWLPEDLPRGTAVDLDTTVLVFSMAVSLLTGIVFGVVPAVYASSPDLATFLKDARRDGGSSSRGTFRSVLVAVEVALALVLLAGAGLALRSFDRLSAVDPGFDPSALLSVSIALPEARYSTNPPIVRFFREYVDSIASAPGVLSAGAVNMAPLTSGGFGGTFSIVGREDTDDYNAQVRAVTPGYFETLRVPLKAGRLFTAADGEHGAPVALLSAEAARRFWPGENPVGRRLRLHVSVGQKEPVREIVGVVGDVSIRALDAPPAAVAYVPHAQYTWEMMTVFARTSSDPAALLPELRARLGQIDREVALTRVRTGRDILAASVAQPRFRMLLLTLFAGLALALAAVGLYGVMAFSVTQRKSELGLRMALGADRRDVLRLVLRQGMAPVAAGILAGLAGAAALTRVMRGLLFDVSPFDPVTLVGVAALLALVAAAACYAPARRATAVDPLIALRNE